MDHILDTVIIGAGPIGLACGIECEKAGLNYIILEKGCLVNSLYNYPKNMTFFSTSERLEIGNLPFVSIQDKPTRSEALEYYRRVYLHWNLKVNLYEKVENIQAQNKNELSYTIKSNKGSYNARSVIVATGFYDVPNKMNIPGEELPKVKHYYDEPHPYASQKVIVVGAANSAVDAALETWRKGAEVTMVVRQEALSRSVKYWVKPDIENRIKEGSIKGYFNSEIVEIRDKEVDIQTPEGLVTLSNDWVLAMTGYTPDFDFLKKVGIEVNVEEHRTPCHNYKTYETNIPRVFLAGVVCGGSITNKWFIENSREHAHIIIEQLKEVLPEEV
ncbi:YpdA family putative bacillithiol disulfide reductase [Xanthovirga aplysinae]|uniref:YpdA family putative bacillithiol disulfide reductase n=1 Tax=Xanthovirga aplysinae TaxID=2529853 RepID=UPI0012BC6F4F|nr:YpdA family putative bacillithiol disulfide reductase [Xanthovirga aplysinae]MTI31338.1 YpdA family putative bacillithiol disulfide reductase [Xanthovirga aplysinae]